MIEAEAKNGKVVSRTANLEVSDEASAGFAFESPHLRAWRASPVSDLTCGPTKARLSTALMGVAWIHLFCFLGCQAVYDPAIITDFRHPLLWIVELVGVLALLTAVLGRGWMRSSPAVNLVAKLWISFLIVAFNAVSLNSFTGFELSWYKPVWATLSTFLFATLAWLFTPLFFIPTVQMWLTGLLMVSLPTWSYLIYGVSWWLALMGIAAKLRQRERNSPPPADIKSS
jgi:hypothetical protein